MFRYKLRAECHSDVQNLMAAMQNEWEFVMLELLDPGMPDEEFTFDSRLELEEIKQKLLDIPDSHVMYETVEFYDNYTGKRRYDYPEK